MKLKKNYCRGKIWSQLWNLCYKAFKYGIFIVAAVSDCTC